MTMNDLPVPYLADPFADPAAQRNVISKRILAYFVDLCLAGTFILLGYFGLAVGGLLTFGFLWVFLPVTSIAILVAYHSLQIGGPKSATWGMRLFGLEVRAFDGRRPEPFQAMIQTLLFYATVPPTCSLILFAVFFTPRGRTIHEILSGTFVVNRGILPG